MSFAAELERLREEKLRTYPLLILVWGPGDPGPDGPDLLRRLYVKREDIRAHLRQRFPSADVQFSEDLVSGTDRGDTILAQELEQAAVAHSVFVLDVSRGAHVEVDVYSTYAVIAAKMHVFLPEEYIGRGLAREVHDRLRSLEGFTDKDLADCRVAKRCGEIAMSKALELLLRGPGAS
ncbi:MAG: hypothetical protein LC808_27285 [Actinobacteria bacterium]|nr:hypothetical protein [Actinomycetota bacterium]